MTAADLLCELEAAGFELRVDGKHLRVRCPAGELSDQQAEAIRRHKSALLKLLWARPKRLFLDRVCACPAPLRERWAELRDEHQRRHRIDADRAGLLAYVRLVMGRESAPEVTCPADTDPGTVPAEVVTWTYGEAPA